MKKCGTNRVRTLAFVAGLTFYGTALADIEFDQDVTPDVIFGTGNANGAFTTDRNDGVEIGLRGKLRHNASGAPEDTFNSNGDGTYSFQPGVAPFQPFPTGEWSFEWSVNTDYDDSSGDKLNDLTYELGLDGDPGIGTNFLSFDPITAGVAAPFWDHAIGDNITANGGGDGAVDVSTYEALLSANNVAQNSWKAHWFFPSFNPTYVGIYDIYLLAKNSKGKVVASSEVRILAGVDIPTDKNQCKKGGWMDFDPILEFKNQGNCVSFVNTGK